MEVPKNGYMMSQTQLMYGGKSMWAIPNFPVFGHFSNFILFTTCLEWAWWFKQWVPPLLSSTTFLAGQRSCHTACEKVSHGASGCMASASDKKWLWKRWWSASWLHAHGMLSMCFLACNLSHGSFRFQIHLIHRAVQHLRKKNSSVSRMKFIRRFFKKYSKAFNIALTMGTLTSVLMASPACYTLVSWLSHRMRKKQPTSVDVVQLEPTTHVQSAWFHTQIYITSLVNLRTYALQKICRLWSPLRQKQNQKVQGRRFSKLMDFIM